MSTREKILAAVAANQPELLPLPDVSPLKIDNDNAVDQFITTLTTIGGKVIAASGFDDINTFIAATTKVGHRVVTTLIELNELVELINDTNVVPHTFQDVELCILKAHLGVAENGAVWLKDALANHRVLPFICQNLAVVVSKKDIVATMHHAYEVIGTESYGYGTFIAGPSKTADIEQSLVLGAHGSRTMTVFLVD